MAGEYNIDDCSLGVPGFYKQDVDIKNWKQHADHLQAQEKGKRDWYESYEVQVGEVLREYQYSD